MKRAFILIATSICLSIFYSCKKEDTTIVEKEGWYALTSEYSNYSLYSVYFVNENNGYIVGSDGLIIRTTNSGLKWTRQTSGTTNDLMSVFFVNENIGYAAGNDGVIL